VTLKSEKWLLQRGRARAGAECIVPVVVKNREVSASTGPRPRGRGMLSGRCKGFGTSFGFNGAAPARARNGELVCSTEPVAKLQRGRARAGAECPRAGIRRRRVGRASTGPRPRGRGMRPRAIHPSIACRGFNGAAPARARNELC